MLVAEPQLLDGHSPDLGDGKGDTCGNWRPEGEDARREFPVARRVARDDSRRDSAANDQEHRGHREEDGKQVDPELAHPGPGVNLGATNLMSSHDLGEGGLGAPGPRVAVTLVVEASPDDVAVPDAKVLCHAHVLDQVRATDRITRRREPDSVVRPLARSVDPFARQASREEEAGCEA